MSSRDNVRIAPDNGKVGVLIPGMGAVTTTVVAGLEVVMMRGETLITHLGLEYYD